MKVKFLLSALSIAAVGTGVYLNQSYQSDTNAYSPRNESFSGNSSSSYSSRGFFENIRKNVSTGKVEDADLIKAREAAQAKRSKRSSLGLNWSEVGPNNVGGRTREIVIDKDNSNRVYAGSVSGGLFISDNAGGTWRPYDDLQDNLAVSTMAQASNGDIYVGTGCVFEGGDRIPGGGIMKSTDGGNTFNFLPSTVPAVVADRGDGWAFIQRIKVDPNNPSLVAAGTGDGLMLSSDGGNTWTNKFSTSCGVINGVVQDVEFAPSGRMYFVMAGILYYTDNPTGDFCTEYKTTETGWTTSQRTDVTICPSDPNKMYALQVAGGDFKGVIESDDAGLNWYPMTPAAPTVALDSTFAPMGSDPFLQGFYDAAILVYPNDCEKILIGGVDFYRADPNWERVSSGFTTGDFYVHSDIHNFAFDPNDDNILYIASDGGVGKSLNAKDDVMRFIEANRNYNVTQYYATAFSSDGLVIGGTQDNGTHLIDPSQPGTFMDATRILGGDGFDCEISDIGQLAITSLYFNDIYRQNATGSQESVVLGGGYKGSGQAPFNSVVKHWESTADPTSQASVTYYNNPVEAVVGLGDGITRIYSGSLQIVQPEGDLVSGSVYFEDLSTSQIVEDANNDGILTLNGDSVGTISYVDLSFTFKLDSAPASQSQVKSFYTLSFDAGDKLLLTSNTQDVPFVHVLQNPLVLGDSVVAKDSVQAMTASVVFGNVLFTRDMLQEDEQVEWIELNNTLSDFGGMSGTVTCIEFSEDGNHIYVGTNSGVVYRYSGLNKLYKPILNTDVDTVLTRTRLFTESRTVTGIVMHPNDPEKLLITLGDYTPSGGEHVYEITNAQSAFATVTNGLANSVVRDVTGDFINIPVYDAEYNKFNDSQVLLATELGIWSTADINATNVTWASENAELANVQVLDIRQQRKEWNEAANSGYIYAATYGRGIWVTANLVSTEDDDNFISKSDEVFSSLKVFPNPTNNVATIEFDLPESRDVDIKVFDLTGKVIRNFSNNHFEQGTSQFNIDASILPAGTYFVTLSSDEFYNMSKFVVVK